MKIILDPAHGIETPGKRSPDGRFREYKWSREMVSRICNELKENNIDCDLTVNDDFEPGLKERVRITNKLSSEVNDDAIFVSIHCNAAGDGTEWMNARGFSIWTSRGKTKADEYAEIIYNEFDKSFPDIPIRSDFSDGDPDYESNFAVLMCRVPAVLLEVLFQDNKKDVEILESEEFKKKFCECIINAIQLIIISSRLSP
jgi:N-acetylmuramoyl-L-alanine amidase